MELFESPSFQTGADAPLSVRMSPRSLAEFVGQRHLLAEGKLLRKIIEADLPSSFILYGPPGCGKTALARVVAGTTRKFFHHLNAVTATVADVREVIARARERKQQAGRSTILFLDEIAHFNKLQQDALMRDVEEGTIVLLCATTHNPYFYVNSPLLSRLAVFQLQPLSEKEIREVLVRALKDQENGLAKYRVRISEEALAFLARMCEGDARRALNALEIGVLAAKGEEAGVEFDLKTAEEAVGRKRLLYDKGEDGHYNTISAFIKSMRGSDPDAALYWLAQMIAAGEDPRFIARRILICAAEDIGNADPQALTVANSAYQAVEVTGLPEAKIILAQAVIYLATAPKSNSAYRAVENALAEVEKEKSQEVPKHLQQAGYRGAEKLGRGIGYLYPHDFPGHYVPQEYMPSPRKFYFPSDQGYEKKIQFFLRHLERLKKEYEKGTKKKDAAGQNPDASA